MAEILAQRPSNIFLALGWYRPRRSKSPRLRRGRVLRFFATAPPPKPLAPAHILPSLAPSTIPSRNLCQQNSAEGFARRRCLQRLYSEGSIQEGSKKGRE